MRMRERERRTEREKGIQLLVAEKQRQSERRAERLNGNTSYLLPSCRLGRQGPRRQLRMAGAHLDTLEIARQENVGGFDVPVHEVVLVVEVGQASRDPVADDVHLTRGEDPTRPGLPGRRHAAALWLDAFLDYRVEGCLAMLEREAEVAVLEALRRAEANNIWVVHVGQHARLML